MRLAVILSIALLEAIAAGAQQKAIRVTGGDAEARGVAIRVPWTGEAPERSPVLRASNGDTVPAQIRNGELHAVIEIAPAGKVLDFSIEAGPKRSKGGVRIEAAREGHVLEVRVGRELLTAYHYDPEERKPYLWPVNGMGEVGMTRDYPMGARVKTIDHKHQQSLWTSYGYLNDADFWEYNERSGWQETRDIEWGSGPVFGWIRAKNVWVDAQREPVIQEEREYRFYATDPERRFFDLDVVLTAAHGDVQFHDTKEGGLIALRMRDDLRERGGSGTITNSEGGVGMAECWGKPAAWVDYSGPVEKKGVRGVAVFDHPSSFRHPSYWHARDYGLVAANAFGYSDFTDGALNGDYLLEAGESISFRYRVLLHTGDVNEAKVAEYYEGFAQPVAVEMVGQTSSDR